MSLCTVVITVYTWYTRKRPEGGGGLFLRVGHFWKLKKAEFTSAVGGGVEMSPIF